MPRFSSGRRTGRVLVAALAASVLTTAASAGAQSVADSAVAAAPLAVEPTATTAPDAPATPVGPTLEGARVGAARSAAAAAAAPATAPVSGPRAGRPIALMVVGGAALILGAIIGHSGGTAVAVGGAVVGLVGLYQFIR